MSTQKHMRNAAIKEQLNEAILEDTQIENLDAAKVWNRRKLARCLNDMESLVKWCQEEKLLPTIKKCTKGHLMKLPEKVGSSLPSFRCRLQGCDESRSITIGTWFENSHLDPEKILRLSFASFGHCEIWIVV